MRIHGIGTDLVEVERIAASVEKLGAAFLERVFTATERDYCLGHARPAVHLAARFAAKEAVAKAFGTGIGRHAGLTDIEIVNGPEGAPAVRLHGAAAAFAAANGIDRVLVSLTHTQTCAAANAVAVGEG